MSLQLGEWLPQQNIKSMSINVDKSVENESCGKNQNDFLNWLQDKLEEEMKKPSYQNYVRKKEQRKVTRR